MKLRPLTAASCRTHAMRFYEALGFAHDGEEKIDLKPTS
jgi:hypothetical protein